MIENNIKKTDLKRESKNVATLDVVKGAKT